MKKLLYIPLILLLGVTLLTGCQKNDTPEEADSETIEQLSNMPLVKINVEGLGHFAYAEKDNTLEFDKENKTQSVVFRAERNEKVTIEAKADEGWKFSKWTKNGNDFSTEEKIEVTIDAEVEYIAVFVQQ